MGGVVLGKDSGGSEAFGYNARDGANAFGGGGGGAASPRAGGSMPADRSYNSYFGGRGGNGNFIMAIY